MIAGINSGWLILTVSCRLRVAASIASIRAVKFRLDSFVYILQHLRKKVAEVKFTFIAFLWNMHQAHGDRSRFAASFFPFRVFESSDLLVRVFDSVLTFFFINV